MEQTKEITGSLPKPPAFRSIGFRLRSWLDTLQRDPSAEERTMQERRARLLEELNQAIAEAPEDMPLRDVIERLNHPYDD